MVFIKSVLRETLFVLFKLFLYNNTHTLFKTIFAKSFFCEEHLKPVIWFLEHIFPLEYINQVVADTFQMSSQYFFGINQKGYLWKFWELIWNVPATAFLIYYSVHNTSERIYSNGNTFKKPEYLLQVLLTKKYRVCVLLHRNNINKTNKVSRKKPMVSYLLKWEFLSDIQVG